MKRNLEMDKSAVWAGTGCMAVSPISRLCFMSSVSSPCTRHAQIVSTKWFHGVSPVWSAGTNFTKPPKVVNICNIWFCCIKREWTVYLKSKFRLPIVSQKDEISLERFHLKLYFISFWFSIHSWGRLDVASYKRVCSALESRGTLCPAGRQHGAGRGSVPGGG